MRRLRIIAIAAMLGVFGAAVPITAALYVSWTSAIKAEQGRLSFFAARTIMRANRSLAEVGEALRTVSQFDGEPCSLSHISEMRLTTMNTPSVAEIGHFENDILACTS